MTTPKIGVLVAIPIKGRKLMNRSGGKQSPYVQLKLGEQKKRTKASLIAAAEPEWDQEANVFHGQMDMNVSVYDEGKKNELIGEGILLLHEVVDKGELDVWFPIKYNGTAAGDIYFELTFYASAPPPTAGGTPPIPQAQIQTPVGHIQPGYPGPGVHPLPHTPPVSGFGSPAVGQPTPFLPYNATPRPFPASPYPAAAPFGVPPVSGPGYNQPFGGAPPFRPPGASPYPTNATPQFGSPNAPGGGYPQMPQPFPGSNTNYPPNNNNINNMPPRFPAPQHPSPGGQQIPSFPQGPGGPPNSFPSNGPNNNYPNNGPPPNFPNNNNFNSNGPSNNNFNQNGPNNNFNQNGPNNNNFNRPNNSFSGNGPNNFNGNGPNNFNGNGPNNNNFGNNGPNNNNFNNNYNNNNQPGAPVTPLVQYNNSLGSFP
ncbi:hypothetical protein BGZ80_005378 [Entomortierella chlamydospora]|uniref:C2 domain-containing protein n=1 Tax=Entomortierella chlamydospora TaxID=101097 RepID=A0A9P6SUX6_9FUNG|nr:hypothetical protein BGZ79_011123 [Entomortierella chlamydospora]KAG0005846.1 hypothetical protein BGZ80_005378 [Entomortierella chlamydospora]